MSTAADNTTLDDLVLRYAQRLDRQVAATQPWTPVIDYSWKARKDVDGPQVALIRATFTPKCVVDAGSGPGHLVRLLQNADIDAVGFDVSPRRGTGVLWGDLMTGKLDWKIPQDPDLVICREVLEHLTVRQIMRAVRTLVRLSRKWIYLTTRFCDEPTGLLDFQTSDALDPTHITLLPKAFLALLFILEGCHRRPDLEEAMDWRHLDRVLVFEKRQPW